MNQIQENKLKHTTQYQQMKDIAQRRRNELDISMQESTGIGDNMGEQEQERTITVEAQATPEPTTTGYIAAATRGNEETSTDVRLVYFQLMSDGRLEPVGLTSLDSLTMERLAQMARTMASQVHIVPLVALV